MKRTVRYLLPALALLATVSCATYDTAAMQSVGDVAVISIQCNRLVATGDDKEWAATAKVWAGSDAFDLVPSAARISTDLFGAYTRSLPFKLVGERTLLDSEAYQGLGSGGIKLLPAKEVTVPTGHLPLSLDNRKGINEVIARFPEGERVPVGRGRVYPCEEKHVSRDLRRSDESGPHPHDSRPQRAGNPATHRECRGRCRTPRYQHRHATNLGCYVSGCPCNGSGERRDGPVAWSPKRPLSGWPARAAAGSSERVQLLQFEQVTHGRLHPDQLPGVRLHAGDFLPCNGEEGVARHLVGDLRGFRQRLPRARRARHLPR